MVTMQLVTVEWFCWLKKIVRNLAFFLKVSLVLHAVGLGLDFFLSFIYKNNSVPGPYFLNKSFILTIGP